MIGRGRVAVVLGRRGLSAILVAVAGLVFYTIFLAVLAKEPSAQTDDEDTGGEISANQNDQSDGDCPGAEEVEVVTGNGDKQSPVFDISGNSFRITVDSTATRKTHKLLASPSSLDPKATMMRSLPTSLWKREGTTPQ